MALEFRFPDVGEGITEGEIVEWKVAAGDRVEAHQTLVVMETDKAVVEIPSPVAGTVLELRGDAGDVIPVGDVLAVIGEPAGVEAAPEAPRPEKPRAAQPPEEVEIPIPGGRLRREEPFPTVSVTRGSVGVVGELEEAPEEEEEQAELQRPAEEEGRLVSRVRAKALPKDRLLARKLGVDVDTLRGTGSGGRVTEEDIRRATERGLPGREPAPAVGTPGRDAHGPVETVRVRGVRRKVAEAMVRSLATAAQVTTTDEARVGLLWHIREKEKETAGQQGVRLTPLAFILKAAVAALKRDPYLNSTFDDEAGEIVLKGYYHIGVAVETRDGLIVPNVKDADRKTILEIARDLQDLSVRARERSLTVQDLKGGTFTISNYGSIGGLYSTPILNPPEVGLLGLGRVFEKPVAVDGAIKIEKVLPLSLTFDHRVVDGATAQHFLNNLVRYLEDPDRILIGE